MSTNCWGDNQDSGGLLCGYEKEGILTNTIDVGRWCLKLLTEWKTPISKSHMSPDSIRWYLEREKAAEMRNRERISWLRKSFYLGMVKTAAIVSCGGHAEHELKWNGIFYLGDLGLEISSVVMWGLGFNTQYWEDRPTPQRKKASNWAGSLAWHVSSCLKCIFNVLP